MRSDEEYMWHDHLAMWPAEEHESVLQRVPLGTKDQEELQLTFLPQNYEGISSKQQTKANQTCTGFAMLQCLCQPSPALHISHGSGCRLN